MGRPCGCTRAVCGSGRGGGGRGPGRGGGAGRGGGGELLAGRGAALRLHPLRELIAPPAPPPPAEGSASRDAGWQPEASHGGNRRTPHRPWLFCSHVPEENTEAQREAACPGPAAWPGRTQEDPGAWARSLGPAAGTLGAHQPRQVCGRPTHSRPAGRKSGR